MKIRDMLEQKNRPVQTITSSKSVRDAVRAMNTEHIGALIAVGSNDEVLGIISERDVLRNIEANVLDKKVADIMTPKENLVVGHPNDTVDYAMHIFVNQKVRHLPILDEETGKLAGIISIGDVVNTQLSDKEFENKMMMNYIMGSYGA